MLILMILDPSLDPNWVNANLFSEYGPQVPEIWSEDQGSDPYICVDLNSDCAEYQKVAQNFASTGGSNIVKVSWEMRLILFEYFFFQIQRVQNKTLYLQYQVYKNERDQVIWFARVSGPFITPLKL